MSSSLIAELDSLPQDWPLCAVNGEKRPYHPDQKFINGKPDPNTPSWNQPLPRPQLTAEIQTGQCKAIGLLTGKISNIIAVDHDGESCDQAVIQLSGKPVDEALPPTVGVTSGKPGRYQVFYRMPEQYGRFIEGEIVYTGVKDADGKDEQLDFRWNGKQSVITGQHPKTARYQWLERQSPSEIKIAECPAWIIRKLQSLRSLLPKDRTQQTDRDWALEYLSYIKNQDFDWYKWRNILLALHHSQVEEDLARLWSSTSEKHTGRGFDDVWQHVKDNCDNPLTVASLAELAKQGGWRGRSPHQRTDAQGVDLEVLELDTKRELIQRNTDFDLCQLFPAQLSRQLEEIARVFNQPATVVAAPLLGIAGSLLQVGTFVHLNGKTGYQQPPIVWVCLVGNSDDGKSPILKILTEPLLAMQSQAWQDYQFKKESWEADLAQWEGQPKSDRGPKPKPPALRRFWFDDFTIEALADSLRCNPDRGVLVLADELAALILGFNQYRKTGNDRQKYLSLYDGGTINVARKTSSPIFIGKTVIPIVGGVQPCVLRDVMGNLEHVDGFWPRFYYVWLSQGIMPLVDWSDDEDTGLNRTLSQAYQNLNNLPAKVYALSPDCRSTWGEWHELTEQTRFEQEHPAQKSLYRKARARAARIALVVHCLNAAIAGEIPADLISADTLRGAITLTKHGLDQIQSIYADFGVTDSPEAVRVAKFVDRFRGYGWIDWMRIRTWWSASKKPNQRTCLNLMELVVKLGYAISNGESGQRLQIKISDSSQVVINTPKPPMDQQITPVTNLVTVTKDSVIKSPDSQDEINAQGVKEQSMTNELVTMTELVTNSNPLPSIDFEHLDGDMTKPLSMDQVADNDSVVTNGKNKTLAEQYKRSLLQSPDDRSSDPATGEIPIPAPSSPNPRSAVRVDAGKIEVDLTGIDLSYQPIIRIPAWQPTNQPQDYQEVSKLYLDIETTGLDPASDRVVVVGSLSQAGEKTYISNLDEAELLIQVRDHLIHNQPQVLIGHNLFAFDLPFLMARWQRYGISYPFIQNNKPKTITASSFRGKPIEFTPIRWSGVDIIDTLHQITIWDKSAAKLTSYSLKSAVLTLGLRAEKRLELSATQILDYWQQGDTLTIMEYLGYDLDDTQLLANFLLPIIWYQQRIVTGLSFQDLAIASPALKAQKIHEKLGLPLAIAQDSLKYEGAIIDCVNPGLHQQVAKIDVSSLYPSIMLRYGICSVKDPQYKFLGVVQYMTQERLRQKQLARFGDKLADHQQNALKILINGSYGYFGTRKYAYNDFTAAALVTAYGRKILRLMQQVVEDSGATVIELDTDGILFSHDDPQGVTERVQADLPEGIRVDLELAGCGAYVPKAKTYVIVHPDGKTTVKGLFRKRDRYPLENDFPVELIRRYFQESPEAAQQFYESTRDAVISREILIERLTVTRKIAKGEKKLVELRLGQPGDMVSFYYTEAQKLIKDKPYKSMALEANTGDYWIDYYLRKLDTQYQEIIGTAPQKLSHNQLTLFDTGSDAVA